MSHPQRFHQPQTAPAECFICRRRFNNDAALRQHRKVGIPACRDDSIFAVLAGLVRSRPAGEVPV
jgi:hypothetical protein